MFHGTPAIPQMTAEDTSYPMQSVVLLVLVVAQNYSHAKLRLQHPPRLRAPSPAVRPGLHLEPHPGSQMLKHSAPWLEGHVHRVGPMAQAW